MTTANSRPPVDPDLQKLLDKGPSGLDTEDGVGAARERLAEMHNHDLPQQLQAVQTENRQIDGPGGPIPIRTYRADQAASGTLPLTMYFHGGGFCLGNLDSHNIQARTLAIGAAALIVSVDYRLAPEHPFPAGVEDVWAATQWAVKNATELGADATRLAVAGDSAGGNLAAVVAQMARDKGGPEIAFQLLFYPATMWDFTLPSMIENAHAPVLTVDDLNRFYSWYAGGVDITNPPARMAPGRATDLSGLPAAYIATAGHDPLRDDGLRYAEMLTDAGNDVQYHNAPTLTHAFLGFYDAVPAVTTTTDLGLAALRAALH
ncbi:MAG: alpha/beta hydrolase [Mycobacterium sp.]